ncbi:hypothetical protein [Nonomuraea sp. NPDC050643]|uniref:hypothetical protein n=1 Tax=Nonomuraea sp. NPDC050643 TaxID=3155660 RepID=UPI0033D40092
MTDLRSCCQKAFIDRETPEEHFPRCTARDEDPQTEALFDPFTPAPTLLDGPTRTGGDRDA